ncbi:MAG: helix-turn-helix domain containing protein [Saprospiraceae bacterium]|jgi:transposase|nr:helix-turn-helix domain containing protein [Saprospiraceae bacterium]
MGRKILLELSETQREELEEGYRNGRGHTFRQRCRMVLLKFQGLPGKEISPIVGIKSQNQINRWVKRYQDCYAELGLESLRNEPGQGRKTILDPEQDEDTLREAVKSERQRLSQAKRLVEEQTGKTFHLKTLKRFLKDLSADISASDAL